MTRIDSTMLAPRWALLPAVAAIALFAALPAAHAADQQTTDEETIYALSQEVAGAGPYAQATAPAPAPVVRRHHHAQPR